MGFNALKLGMGMITIVVLSACSSKEAPRPTAVFSGPDEFSTLPSKPLEAPEDFTALPTPTPFGANRADVTPKADAIAALGGRAPTSNGVDGGIVSYASRYGVDPSIRATLAKADKNKAKRGSALSLPWKRDKYERAYKRFALDPYAEWQRLRALGIKVPAAPPKK